MWYSTKAMKNILKSKKSELESGAKTASGSRNLVADEVLVEEFLNDFNKVSSFEELLKRYEPKLNRYVRSLGVEQNMAFDIVQEAFLKAYRNIRSFNPKKGKWSSWIYRVAHNCAMDHFKKAKKDLTVDEDEWWDSIAVPETITKELNLKLDSERLAKFMSSLDVKYRHPLTLYFLEGRSYKEIGSILRLPTATVSTRIKRGKERLLAALEEDSKKVERMRDKKSDRKLGIKLSLPDASKEIEKVKQTISRVRSKSRKNKKGRSLKKVSK